MAIQFTPEQQKVIELHHRNILVSAAAGSGKTAVLVERIIQMISREEDPLSIDRLLIVTFTSAAAAQMRERIQDAIEDKLNQFPESEHLQRQATLIHNAQITTIDSFCLFIIRNNFNDIQLDPGFRVADEGELELIQQDILNQLLEEKFEEGKESFLHCVECFCPNGREKALEENIRSLYRFSISFPFPEDWLLERKRDYDCAAIEEFEESPLAKFGITLIRDMIQDCLEKLQSCVHVTEEPDGPYMYGALLDEEVEMVSKLCDLTTFSAYQEKMETINFQRLPSKKDDSVNQEKREWVKETRAEVKAQLGTIKEKYFSTLLETTLVQSAYAQTAVEELLDITLEFLKRFQEKKKQNGMIDFSDMEHFALNILLKKEKDKLVPTRAALDYQNYFDEVLIDEYQDSNLVQEYLLKAVSKEESGAPNRFMVGDVKQSIYKFRLARPELFLEKYRTYSQEEALFQRIDLHKNFRSRKEVVNSVNALFSQLMGEKLGGIVYDDAAALYSGAVYPQNSGCETELLLIDKPEKSAELSAKEQEARHIAMKIKSLLKEFRVTDSKTGELRAVQYKDIVILLRSNSGWDEEFRRVFIEQGIPAHISSKTGYFSTLEIQTLLQFLRILDNPLQDIPLFGTLKSVFGGFDEEDIVKIKTFEAGKKTLFEKLKTYAVKGNEKELTQRVNSFLEMVEEFRKKTVYLPIRKLLQEILTRFQYLNYVTALPAGEQRRANVEMLLMKASAFEKTSFYGLFHFIRYVEQLHKYDVDYGEANILDENADVVRIMSIHKSKGLEFPVTFVSGLSKRFNMQDTNQAFIVDMDMGVGVDYVNPDKRVRNKTLRKNLIARKLQLDNLAEELRILYVAMTRAKEKLILTGTMENVQEKLQKYQMYKERKEKLLPFAKLVSSGSYLDFILPAAMRCEPEELQVTLLTEEDVEKENLTEIVQEGIRKRELFDKELSDTEMVVDMELKEFLKERFSYVYEHGDLQNLYTKTTVSELKKAAMSDDAEGAKELYEEAKIVPYIPKFVQEQENISGATRGSAFHKVMELLDFEELFTKDEGKAVCLQNAGKILDAQLSKLEAQGRLTKEYREAVSTEKLLCFLKSELAGRMCVAKRRGQLYREQPFVYGIDAKRVNPAFPKEEKVLIQGIIDAFFIEENEVILVDYKTDVIQEPKELIHRYKVQLEYYQEAIEHLMAMPVGQRILYSFYLGREIYVQDE